MPARDQQHQVRVGHAIGQPRRQRVPGQMVDADQVQPGPGGDPLGAHHPGDHPADQPRPGRDRDGVQIAQGQIRSPERLAHAGIQLFGMRACRDFGHHAAIIGMQHRLIVDDRGQDRGRAIRAMRTSAAAVSSQLLSRPRKISGSVIAPGKIAWKMQRSYH